MVVATTRIRKMTLSSALDKYIQTVSVYKRGYKQEFYRASVLKRSCLALRYMDEITSIDIAEYRDERLSTVSDRTGRTIGTDTVRLELALLSSLYNLARIEWGTCSANPVALVRKPSPSSGRTRRLASAEERRITRACAQTNPQLLDIIQLAIETAMRQGEILSLRWEHVDLHRGIAHLPLTKNGSARDVPLSYRARQVLQRRAGPSAGPVFSYTSDGLKSAWRTLLIRLSITDLHFHDLRHEAVSRLFELGTLSAIEIAAISGHKSMNMLKRYTHLRATHLVSKLDARHRQTRKLASYFVPYPAEVINQSGKVTVRFTDLEHPEIIAPERSAALDKAASVLLRLQAQAAQAGRRLPQPGEIYLPGAALIMIDPLCIQEV